MYTHGIEPFRTFSTNQTISFTLTEEVNEEKMHFLPPTPLFFL